MNLDELLFAEEELPAEPLDTWEALPPPAPVVTVPSVPLGAPPLGLVPALLATAFEGVLTYPGDVDTALTHLITVSHGITRCIHEEVCEVRNPLLPMPRFLHSMPELLLAYKFSSVTSGYNK